MESLSNFFDIFYSIPIAFYSVPFTIFFVLVALSVLGLHFDFNIDIDAASVSEGLKMFLSHFNLSRVPIFLYLFIYTLIGSGILIFVHDFVGKGLILNIIAVVNVYIAAKLASVILVPLAPLFEGNKDSVVNYIGLEATVTSFKLTNTGGTITCDYNGSEHYLDAWVDGEDVLDKGDRVLILIKEGDKYQVEKLKDL